MAGILGQIKGLVSRPQYRNPNPGDTVVPVPLLDGSWMIKAMVMSWSMRFDQVLDGEMLKSSLEELIGMGNWRRLGGRYQMKADGQLELHIPKVFSPDRPAIRFTQTSLEMSLRDHELDRTVPTSSIDSRIIDISEENQRLLRGPDSLLSFPEYLSTDVAPLALHIITFQDATFVTLTYPHSLTDGMGRRELVINWCRTLAGQKEEVQPLADFDDDPISRIMKRPASKTTETPPPLHKSKQLAGLSFLLFVLTSILDMIYMGRSRSRTLFLSATAMARLRTSAMEDLEMIETQEAISKGGAGKDIIKNPKSHHLGDSDILTAWFIRLISLAAPPRSPRPLAITSPVDLRLRLDEKDLDTGRAYVQNLLKFMWVYADTGEALSRRFGYSAKKIRESVQEQISGSPDIHASIRDTGRALKASGMTPLFLTPNTFMVSMSNVSAAKFHQVVNFAPAVVGAASQSYKAKDDNNRVGRPVWQVSFPQMTVLPPCLVHVQGKDHDGNYWVQMNVSRSVWKRVEKEIARL